MRADYFAAQRAGLPGARRACLRARALGLLKLTRAMALQSLTEEQARGARALLRGGRAGQRPRRPGDLHRRAARAHAGRRRASTSSQSIDELGELARGGAEALAPHAHSPGFLGLRALACEAFYSDFVAPGRDATGAWDEIDFHPRAAAFLQKDWSYLGIEG